MLASAPEQSIAVVTTGRAPGAASWEGLSYIRPPPKREPPNYIFGSTLLS